MDKSKSTKPRQIGEVESIAGDPSSGIILLCDHATNAVPAALGTLGLPAGQMQRHIAYDIGAAAMTRAMAATLNAPAILTNFSRLLIDPNRGPEDPTLVRQISDGAIIPANYGISAAGVAARVAQYYAPYDAAITVAIDHAMRAGHPPAIIAIHSFTPQMQGFVRPWHVGILYDQDARLSQSWLAALAGESDLIIGDNEPYRGGLAGDTIDRHATQRGLHNTLIEVRQDLIATEQHAMKWGQRLAGLSHRAMQNLAKMAQAA
jgi:predicted N-formylglutamate amidohydrolase